MRGWGGKDGRAGVVVRLGCIEEKEKLDKEVVWVKEGKLELLLYSRDEASLSGTEVASQDCQWSTEIGGHTHTHIHTHLQR